MSRREQLLTRAAADFERAELYLEAAECYRSAGLLGSAGHAYDRAGDLERAAECLRTGHEPEAAAALYEELGRPVDAAACWEAAGELLRSGWVLAIAGSHLGRARRLFRDAAADTCCRQLLRDLGTALCVARGTGRTQDLEMALLACRQDMSQVHGHAERRLVEEWGVQAADVMGRADLAAQLLAASYAHGTLDVVHRWRSWAARALGDTFGVPEAEPRSTVSAR